MSDKEKIKKLLEIIKELEWSGYSTCYNEIYENDICWYCNNNQKEGHENDCKLNLLLKEISK